MRLVRMNREITMDILVLIQVGGGFWGGYFLPSCIYEEGREKKGKLFQREMVENLKTKTQQNLRRVRIVKLRGLVEIN